MTIVRILRLILSTLLWPIANPRWRENVKRRRLNLRLDYIDQLRIPPDGILNLGGPVLHPILLYQDGTVRFGDSVIPKNGTASLQHQRWRLIRRKDLLTILSKGSQNDAYNFEAILTYDQGGWQQWHLLPTTFGQARNAELVFVRRLGNRLLARTWGIAWKVLVAYLVFILCFAIYLYYTGAFERALREKYEKTTSESHSMEHGTP